MIHKKRNFSLAQPPCEAGDTFEACNLTQLRPDTEICGGLSGLTFRRCNLVNCKPPPDAAIEECNTAQISFCSHLHPEWMDKGLPACAVDCQHRQGATKRWVLIHEPELREIKQTVDPKKPKLRITNTADADGVIDQRFEKEVWVYADARVGKFRPKT